MKKVIDYRYGENNGIIVLCFRSRTCPRIPVTHTAVDNYLIEIKSPYNFKQLHEKVSLEKRLSILTEFYDYKRNNPV